MFYGAKENTIRISGSTMNYVEFGHGQTPFVLLPGLIDGLKTVRGQAVNLAFFYRRFASQYRVYVFSRTNVLAKDCTTKDMARDQKLALEHLGIDHAYIMGISQGGMIAQHFAIDYPEVVDKLILGVSASRPNEFIHHSVHKWINFAKSNDYKSLLIDTLEHTYSLKRLKKLRRLYPILSRIGQPKDFDRFLIQAYACLTHNAYHELNQIKCPTLIIGGDSDKIVGTGAAKEMSQKISGSRLLIYKGLGHAAYEESKSFNLDVMNFLLNN